MSDPLLTSLCSICHTLPYKYRCPRCFVLTCSLPCIRRHKQWAQCSGQRDPAAYVTRADLATPKMIDHDYNYLTSLEREFDKADREASERGILLNDIPYNHNIAKGHLVKGEAPLKEALERCGVIVARAPKGMSRAKANQTHWVKKKRRLAWTVEWVHPDGKKEEGECAEDRPLSEVYDETYGSRRGYVTRKKRKIARERRLRAAQSGEDISSHSAPSDPNAKYASTAPIDPGGVPTEPNLGEVSGESRIEAVPSKTMSKVSQFEFYLHAPSLPSKQPVLVPLEQSATLASSLRNRLVLEFPTIYVFRIGDREPDCGRIVPDGFIIEKDFFARAKKHLVEEVEEGEVADIKAEDEGKESKTDIDGVGNDFDAEHVLKILGQDLKSYREALEKPDHSISSIVI